MVENVLPVHLEPPPPLLPTTTKLLTKPTAHLPGDHGDAPGENTNPAFSTANTGPTATPNPTADEGWFPSMSKLKSNQKWFFSAIGAVAVFGIGLGIFFWQRRRIRMAKYSSLPAADDMSMSALITGHRSGATATASRPTRELYDAFGEVSDDEDEDVVEERDLHPQNRISRGLGFHSGFLDDDNPAAGMATSRYRDEPEATRVMGTDPPVRTASPNGSGESWEHASS